MLGVARSTLRYILLAGGILLILLALLSAVARVGLPLVAGHKSAIEARVSAYLQRPVEIGELAIRWRGMGPQLRAQNVTVVESDELQVSLDELLIDINLAKSAWLGLPVINELTLIGAELAVEYVGDGEFRLHGADGLQASNSSEDALQNEQGLDVIDWLLNARRVALLDTRVTFIDTERQQQLLISELNVRAENKGKLHQLRVDLRLPASLGGSLEMGIDLTGDAHNLASMQGDFYLKAAELQLQGWQALLATVQSSSTVASQLDWLTARADVETWGRWSGGGIQLARSHITASEINQSHSGEALLDQLTSKLDFRQEPTGWSITADRVELVRRDERAVLQDIKFAWKPDSDRHWQLDGKGQRLPLGLLSWLPNAWLNNQAVDDSHSWLAAAQASGEFRTWRASVAMRSGVPDISLHGAFDGLTVPAVDNLPGVRNLSGTLAIDHGRGDINLYGRQVGVELPSVFAQPLQLAVVDAELKVNMVDAARAVISGQATVDDAGLRTTTRFKVKLGQGRLPHVDVQTRFALDDISQALHYLPDRLLSGSVMAWVDGALKAGKVSNGEMLLFGDLADFPFDAGQGVFKAGFDVSNGTLAYWRDWPEAQTLQGRVSINGLSLTSMVRAGHVQDLRISKAIASIDNLLEPVLSIKATGAAELQELLYFATSGPLSHLLKPALSDASGKGRAQMDLALTLPLRRRPPDTTSTGPGLKISGSIFLRDNEVTFDRAQLTLGKVTGAVGFNESGVRINNLRARVFDQPVRLNGATSGIGAEQVTEITLHGALDADLALEHYGIPLTRFAHGRSQWHITLRAPHAADVMVRDGVQLTAVSDLIGTQLDLPLPLSKSSGRAASLRLQSAFRQGQNNVWNVQYGELMQARVVVEAGSMRSLAMRFGAGKVNTLLNDGIRVEGTVPSLAVDGWVKSIADLIDDLPESAEPQPILPVSADLRVASLVAGVHSLGAAQLRANTDTEYLNVVVVNDAIRGNLRYPREHWRQDLTARARISYVDKRVIDALESAPDVAGERPLDPRLLPRLEVRVSRLTWDSLDLRDVTLRTSPKINGLAIDTLGFAHRNTQLIGEGYWHALDPQGVNPELRDEHVTGLSLTLQSDDVGNSLTAMGFAGVVDEGEGTVSASLVWRGPAYAPALQELEGNMSADLQRGRILNVEPGAARMVGLFALQTIPRRLNLDFKDIVSDGLDFQRITAAVTLNDGIADATLVQINGPVGVIDITGQSNLITRQYDQHITVLPRVSAALPIIGMITGGASAGIGALIAGGFLKAIGIDLDRIGLREYDMTGSWDAPEFESVPVRISRQR